MYSLGIYISHNSPKTDSVYVWGDSQMYQGLDIQYLSALLQTPVLSSALHGNGVYDFLVSAECIPPQSTCIIALPECALYRSPNSDRNRTGLSFSSLWRLYEYGCSYEECYRIAIKNHKPYYNPFSASNDLYEYAPKIVYSEPLDGFCDMFNRKNNYAQWKQKAFISGLTYLKKKKCRLVLIQFPFYDEVEKCAQDSYNRGLTNKLKQQLIKEHRLEVYNIKLESDSLLMHDLSHMNELGAKLVTNKTSKIIQSSTSNLLIKFELQ